MGKLQSPLQQNKMGNMECSRYGTTTPHGMWKPTAHSGREPVVLCVGHRSFSSCEYSWMYSLSMDIPMTNASDKTVAKNRIKEPVGWRKKQVRNAVAQTTHKYLSTCASPTHTYPDRRKTLSFSTETYLFYTMPHSAPPPPSEPEV